MKRVENSAIGFVHVRGAHEHNLENLDLDIWIRRAEWLFDRKACLSGECIPVCDTRPAKEVALRVCDAKVTSSVRSLH